MAEDKFISGLLFEIDALEQRIVVQTARVERCTDDEFLEEQALLRNLVMQFEGLKLKLRKM
jgi:hypothetical protein